MSLSPYSEDNLVQKTTADYLEQELGWESIYAFNHEDYGQDSLLGRASDREVVLTRILRQKIEELNPGLPPAAYDEAVRQVVAISAAQTLVATNEEKYGLIRDGVPVSFRTKAGELDRERLRIIDFANPENNHFLCVRELWIRGDLYRRRADIVGFVNGLPLLFMELKNLNKDIRAAYEQNLQDYKDTVPHLFHHNAVVVLANGVDARLGSITSTLKHFHEWKRLDEDMQGIVDMETLLRGVCNKTNLIDIVENFILFDKSTGEARKILAKNHQFLGVNRAMEAVRDRKNRNGKLGVFWHTQGAGKSYSMVLLTRKIHRKLGGNFTFLILTDRDDLDTQIYKTFAGCGVVNNDADPCRAGDGEHLARLLAQHKSHVFSLIQKFNKRIPEGASYTERDDLIVFTDEAHRTQYGKLSINMKDALPNASYLGFTGTPLFSNDEITKQVFGDYLSTYDFQRAVEDNATVPLYYDARGDELGVAVNDLNQKIADKLEELEVEDIDVAQRLEQELKRDYHIITAGQRLDQIARDFVEHYSTSWENGKAMFVCIDKITCVRMHKLIEFYWNEKILELSNPRALTADDQEEQYRQRQLHWMRETQMAVVVSEEQGEVDKFRKWDLDITPYREIIKKGIELPQAMRAKPQFQNRQRMSLEDAFKSDEHPLRVAIVCAMWLIGFDVPCLSTLYLDKPLKAHTLMQAIARANRVYEGKNNGLIVDYCGILRHLRQALATFAGTQDSGHLMQQGVPGQQEPMRPQEELLSDLAEAIGLLKTFLLERNAPLAAVINEIGFARNAAIMAAKEAANENDETRKRFEVMCRVVFSKFKACLTLKGVKQYRDEHAAISIIYESLQKDRQQADISGFIRELHAIVDEAITTKPQENTITGHRGVYDISAIDFERLRQEFMRSRDKRTAVQSLKAVVEKRLRRLLEQNLMRTNFQRYYEEIVGAYNSEKDRVTIEQSFENLLLLVQQMDEEQNRAVREGLSEESLAVFDLLKKPDLKPAEIKRIKAVAVELLAKLKAEKLRIDHWRERESSRDAVRLAIYDFLYDEKTGLPETSYSEAEVKDTSDKVFVHVLRVYPTLPSPYYAEMAA